MKIRSMVSLSVLAAGAFGTHANAQNTSFSYGGVEIVAAEPSIAPILPQRPERNSNLQIITEEQNGFGGQDEFRLNYRINVSPNFSTNIQSPLIEENSRMRRGFEISGSPRLEFSWLLGTTNSNELMSNQREGVNYNPLLDPTLDQSTLTIFDRQIAKWQLEPVGQIYGMNRR